MSLFNQLLNKIRETNLKTFTLKELCLKLSIHSSYEKKEIGKQLELLIKEGELIALPKQKYMLADKEKYIKGRIRGNARGFAFLLREDGGADLFIPNKGLNGALNKDLVYARLVKGDEAEVISVIERGVSELVGTYKAGKNYGFVIPDDNNNFEDIYIPYNDKNIKNNSKVQVKITDYSAGKKPSGKVIAVLGMSGTIDAEVLSILRGAGFMESFPSGVEDEAARVTELAEGTAREDYSDILTITIDGDDAKDFDDAISLIKTDLGYTLYVHIADVASYVGLNTIIDMEARKRGTSVYFPGQVFPMLPSILSDNYCSLRPGETRRVLSLKMEIDKAGKVVSSAVKEGLITSAERMTYHKVTKIINDDEQLLEEYKHIVPMIKDMRELADILTKIRRERGSINFESKEAYVELDATGKPIDLKPYPYEISNQIIEEFMLLANETIAEYIFHMTYPFVYRIHEKPMPEKINVLKLFLQGFGIRFNSKEIFPNQFSKILESVENSPYKSVVNKVMLRSMSKARYSAKHDEHFGLATRYYCHFTSPIRRYPDLTIHRIIKDIINGRMNEKRLDMYIKLVNEVSLTSTERERAAELAERDIDDYYKALYMKDKIGEVYDGIIAGMNNYGLFVELPSTVEGRLNVEKLQGYGYKLDEKAYTFSNGITTYRLGDVVKIKVVAANEYERRVDFELFVEEQENLE